VRDQRDNRRGQGTANEVSRLQALFAHWEI
jgi:hypothetical protein